VPDVRKALKATWARQGVSAEDVAEEPEKLEGPAAHRPKFLKTASGDS
jgi:hypothetical protein